MVPAPKYTTDFTALAPIASSAASSRLLASCATAGVIAAVDKQTALLAFAMMCAPFENDTTALTWLRSGTLVALLRRPFKDSEHFRSFQVRPEDLLVLLWQGEVRQTDWDGRPVSRMRRLHYAARRRGGLMAARGRRTDAAPSSPSWLPAGAVAIGFRPMGE